MHICKRLGLVESIVQESIGSACLQPDQLDIQITSGLCKRAADPRAAARELRLLHELLQPRHHYRKQAFLEGMASVRSTMIHHVLLRRGPVVQIVTHFLHFAIGRTARVHAVDQVREIPVLVAVVTGDARR